MVALGKDEKWDGFKLGVSEEEYEKLNNLILRQFYFNGWFTEKNVRQSFLALGELLNENELTKWTNQYSFTENPKKVALIMAGNIPIVGFHDFLSVLLSGNSVVCKLSSDDNTLLPALADQLIVFCPELKDRILFTNNRIGEVDAVIATGSDNSLNYFKQYFGKYPHIFRRNRTSVAVLTGTETKSDFENLGHDIFDYFGMGCRNVSHLMLPKGFDLNKIFEGIFAFSEVVNNKKYGNNYDYNKAIFLMNQLQLLDNNFVLLRESTELFSPLAMIYYHFYDSVNEIDSYLEQHSEKIQVVVGKDYVPFGKAQQPELDDYADGVDTMRFLESLNN